MRYITLLTFVFLSFAAMTQTPYQTEADKGRFYMYWGWNRGWYTNADIKIKGEQFDFVLHDVKAVDRPVKFKLSKYFNPTQFSTPQFNFRLGYYIDDHYDISFGIDHMKYVVSQNQQVQISGTINELNSDYVGVYDRDDIEIRRRFLEFEHSDGLNYVNIELRRRDLLVNWKTFSVTFQEGIGIGALLPRTDATVFRKERYDKYHLSGYGISALLGLRIGFLKHFFIQSEGKAGFINMPDVRISHDASDKAKHHFFFGQANAVFGASFGLGGKN